MKEYMILIVRESKSVLSPEESELCMMKYGEWAEKLGPKHLSGHRLEIEEGVLMSKNKEMITDGPFAESKELIAGISLIKAETFDEATSIAKTCPLIDYFNLYVRTVYS